MKLENILSHQVIVMEIAMLLAVGTAIPVVAETVGFWRMEADDDAHVTAVSITNEVGYSALTLVNGGLDSGLSDSVMTNRLANGLTNNAALYGGRNIDGIISNYTNLNTDSITVEFFSRSGENDASIFRRSSDPVGFGFGTNGLCIVDPNDVDIYYAIDDGAGGTTNVTWESLHNSLGEWDHYAFTYDAPTGIGMLYLNGVPIARNDGPDNRSLDWGAGNTDISVGAGMDGGGGLVDRGLFDELRISSTALDPSELLYKALPLVSDSFAVRPLLGGYVAGKVYVNPTNSAVVVGTVGFTTTTLWGGGTTGNFSMQDYLTLNHSMLANEIKGAVRVKAKDSRQVHRQIGTTLPASSEYYMCALLRAQQTEPDESMSVGFSTPDWNRNKGIHVGFNDGRLALFAGGQSYDLMNENYDLNTTYLAVVRLTANAAGDDTVEVYLAKEGDETIDRRVEVSVETFASTSDLDYLKFNVMGHEDDAYQTHSWWFDEVRLATSVADLGIDPALLRIPPPEGMIILVQ